VRWENKASSDTFSVTLLPKCQNYSKSKVGRLFETVYIRFWGLLPPKEFCQVQNSLCVPSLALSYIDWQRCCTALEQSASAKLCGMVQGLELQNFRSLSFSTEGVTYIPRAAITLGIVPYSSCAFSTYRQKNRQVHQSLQIQCANMKQ